MLDKEMAAELEFDDRYELVEKRLIPLAHVPPTVFRYIKLTDVLLKGFETALEHPLDPNVASQPWLTACLKLLCEQPICTSGNYQKFSLTVQDVRAIQETMMNPLSAILQWERAYDKILPAEHTASGDALVRSIHAALIDPYLHYHEDEDAMKVDLPVHPFSKVDGNGNVVYDNSILLGILRGCPSADTVPRYANAAIRNADLFEFLQLSCEGEYDHDAACRNSAMRMQMAIGYLGELDRKFEEHKDDSIRFSLLSFQPGQDPIYTFLAGEFDEPIELHRDYVDEPKLIPMLQEEIRFIVSRLEFYTNIVVSASAVSMAGSKLNKSWQRLLGLFERRSLHGSHPPYREQEDFDKALQTYRTDFNAAIATITAPSVDLDELTGGLSILELGRREVERQLPAAAKLYAQMNPGADAHTPTADEVAQAVCAALEPKLKEIKKDTGWLREWAGKVFRFFKRKGEKNLKVPERFQREVLAMWLDQEKHPENYPEATGRKVNKRDVYGTHSDWLKKRQVNSYEEFVKVIDTARKLAKAK